jgi:gamma-glutamyltranspeptidase/glutathione hydrolase
MPTPHPRCRYQTVLINALALLCLAFAATAQQAPPTALIKDTDKRAVHARQGMVVCAHPAAAAVGLRVLQNGGNAYDAGIATEFALAVCYPIAGNIGGGGVLVFRDGNGATGSLDYRERAPQAAMPTMYQDSSGNVHPTQSKYGSKAAAVPGTVAGMWELHKKKGTRPWDELLQPAIDLAQNGYVLTERDSRTLNRARADFLKYNRWQTPFVRADGRYWQRGDTLRQPALARTLERIRDQGPDGFYAGPTAAAIVAEMEQGVEKGIITLSDLKNYKAVWRTPLQTRYRGYEVWGMPPPSSGGIALVQLLAMLEDRKPETYAHNSVPYVQLLVEAERRVYADRATHLGDMDHYRVPLQRLAGKAYNKARFQNFSFDKATPSSAVAAGNPHLYESTETTHYCVVDKYGNALSATTTINGNYGSKTVVKDAGFFLNNEMDDFSAKPDTPNEYGLVGGAANAIAPGKRPLSSMTPTIVTQNGKLFLVLGSPGGSRIITTVLQGLFNVVHHGMDAQRAVNASRFHHQWLPDEILIETDTFEQEDQDELARKGYTLRVHADKYFCRLEIIRILPDGRLQGGADPRGDDTALGY